MVKTFYMKKEDAFSRNLSECKSAIFGLRYSDITVMCGIPQSTMATYEGNRAPYISPFLGTAKKLADMYCTSVQRLCSYDISFNTEETLKMSGDFIRRLGGADTATYRDEINSELGKHLHFSTKEIRGMIQDAHREIIENFCKEGKYSVTEDDEKICSVFTDNFNYLLTMTGLSYRNVGSVCGIGLGTMSRLKQGAEPSLSVVIRLADFFGVPIESFLSPDPGFDAMKIIAETKGKNALADREDPVPEDMWQKAMKESHDDVYPDEAKKLVTEYLLKIHA